MNASGQEETSFVNPCRLIALFGALVSGFFLVASGASHWCDGSRHGLRQSRLSENNNSLHSWLSFNKQTASLGLTAVSVATVNRRPNKVMELRESNREDIASDDEKVIVKITEHRDPDLSESGTDEYMLEFQSGEHFGKHDVEVALSTALRSGLRDPDQIAKAVSEILQDGDSDSSNMQMQNKQDVLEDKP